MQLIITTHCENTTNYSTQWSLQFSYSHCFAVFQLNCNAHSVLEVHTVVSSVLHFAAVLSVWCCCMLLFVVVFMCNVYCSLQFVAVFTVHWSILPWCSLLYCSLCVAFVLHCSLCSTVCLCYNVKYCVFQQYCSANRVAVVLNCHLSVGTMELHSKVYYVLQFIAVFNVFLMYGSVNCVLLLYRFVHRVVRCSQCVVVNVTLKHNCSTLWTLQ